MVLPDDDVAYLEQAHPGYTVEVEAGMTCVILPNFELPAGYTVARSDLLLCLAGLYPDQHPDMWWFDPPLRLTSGAEIEATQLVETHVRRQWQRWSRHLDPQQWQSGVDGLRSYVSLIRGEIARATPSAA